LRSCHVAGARRARENIAVPPGKKALSNVCISIAPPISKLNCEILLTNCEQQNANIARKALSKLIFLN
jgi:hypothetical protein